MWLRQQPSGYVKKHAQRSEDSILLRHVDDVVGTGPDEHLTSDFEHMKTVFDRRGGVAPWRRTSKIWRSDEKNREEHSQQAEEQS